MKLRPIPSVIAGAALLVAIVVVLAETVLMRSFEHIEAAMARQNAEQVRRAVETDLQQLWISTRDYGEWDDAFEYVEQHDPAFITSNFASSTLVDMHVDMAWILDSQGKEIFSTAVPAATRILGDTTLPQTLAVLKPLIANLAALAKHSPAECIINLRSGLLAFAAVGIIRTDHPETRNGVMLFARFIGPAAIARFSKTSQLPVSVVHIGSSSSAAALPGPTWRWVQSRPASGSNFSLPGGTDRIYGYSLLQDVRGDPIVVLSTWTTRAVVASGRKSTWLLAALIVTVILVFAGALITLLAHLERSWKARASTERRYRAIIHELDESILLADAESGCIIEANAAARRLLGFSDPELAEKRLSDLILDFAALAADGQGHNSQTHSTTAECQLRARDGRLVEAEVSLTSLVYEGRHLTCCVARDSSARRLAADQLLDNQKQLAHLAHHDPLTGLPNRLHLQARLPRMLARRAGADTRVALMYIDLDHFKNVNDLRGHGCGDQLLHAVGGRLRAVVAQEDLVVRMGGDEFVVVALNLQSRDAAQAIAARICDALRAPVQIGDSTLTTTASIGISIWPDDGSDMEVLLKHADIALYQAKERGRDRAQLFSADMNVGLGERLALEQALRHALGTEQIYADYQPLIDLRSGRLVSFEALARWRHPELGTIAPVRFIAVAEECGLITDLGAHILDDVCRRLAEWRLDNVVLVPIGINVSPQQFERSDICETINAAVRKYKIDPGMLNFEITETALMKDPGRHLEALNAIRAIGAHISIDDFGTGYSSLSYLKHLPIDTLKIDRAFVRDMQSNSSDAAIVGAVVSMARSLGLKTVAEGVETIEQLKLLRELGCDTGQGYYFSKPLPARHCRALLEQLSDERRFTETLKMRAFGGAA